MGPLRGRLAVLLGVLPAVLGTVALSGCSTAVAFRTDDRVRFTSPQDRATVTLPVTLTWTVRNFTVLPPGSAPPTRNAGYFAVFVDQAPVPPGQQLRYLARQDKRCRPTDGCPDPAYLQSRGVYTTSSTSLTLAQLPPQTDRNTRERHSAILVLLDSTGRRIGESAFEVDFDVKRSAA